LKNNAAKIIIIGDIIIDAGRKEKSPAEIA